MPNFNAIRRIIIGIRDVIASPSTLLNGLIASYSMEGNSNDSLVTYNGSDTNMSYGLSSGIVTQGALFNGTSSVIALSNTASGWSFIQNTLVFTIAVWLKPTDFTQTFFIMGNTSTSAEKGFFLGSQTDGQIQFVVADGAGNVPINSTANGFFTDNSYILLFVVGDGTTVNFYKGTTFHAGDAKTLSLPTGNGIRNVEIGRINGQAQFFNGSMDIISIWNRALTLDEITEYNNSGGGKQYPFLSVIFWLLTGSLWNNSGMWDNTAFWIN